jgi:hypothetical protein
MFYRNRTTVDNKKIGEARGKERGQGRVEVTIRRSSIPEWKTVL